MKYRTFKMIEELDTIKELAVQDYAEVGEYQGKVKLDPDWDKYIALDNAGALLCCGAYDEDKLVGYYISVVSMSLHSKNDMIAGCDALWLHPDYRGGAGIKLIAFHEKQCKELGVSVITMNVTRHHDISPLLERLGWNMIEKSFGKCIKEQMMALATSTIMAISAVTAAVGTAASVHSSNQAADARKEQSAQAQATNTVEAAKARRENLRRQRIQQAEVEAQGAAAGTAASSANVGTIDALAAQTATSTAGTSGRMLALGNQAQLNNQMAESQQRASTFNAVAGFASSGFNLAAGTQSGQKALGTMFEQGEVCYKRKLCLRQQARLT